MNRGGWRYGAGRPAWHAKAENCRRLDVRRLSRDGSLREGASCTWGWQVNGESRGTVGMRAESDALVFTYSMNGTSIRQRLPILRTACHFGGGRPWFACPRCGRRVAVLFLRDDFNCRACSRVAYASQPEDALGRPGEAAEDRSQAGGELAASEGHAPRNVRATNLCHLAMRGGTRGGSVRLCPSPLSRPC